MNQDQVKGKWNHLLEVEGDIDKLSGKIQERTGDRKEDVRKWLNERYQ